MAEGKDKVGRYQKDMLKRLQQSKMRGFVQTPDIIQDPANPEQAIPEGAALYPLEKGGAPTGVGSDGTTPYSPEYWKKKEKHSPGTAEREELQRKGVPEEKNPIGKDGQVKRLLRYLRQPAPAVAE